MTDPFAKACFPMANPRPPDDHKALIADADFWLSVNVPGWAPYSIIKDMRDALAAPHPLLADAVREAFMAGFKSSGEGWNGEYPFEGKAADDPDWESVKNKADTFARETLTKTKHGGGV